MSYNTFTPIVTDGLVLCLDAANTKSYPGTGTSWLDLSKVGGNGTLIGGPSFSSSNGGNIVFDGINDYVITNYFGSDNNNSYSFSVWFNPLSNINVNVLNRGRDGSGGVGSGWSILLGTDNTSGHRYRTAVVINSTLYIIYGGTVEQNKWVQLTGVYNYGNSLSLYVNGIFTNSIVTPALSLRTSTDGWVLGSITTTAFTNQLVSSVFIYNRVLSASEVLQNYNATKYRYIG